MHATESVDEGDVVGVEDGADIDAEGGEGGVGGPG